MFGQSLLSAFGSAACTTDTDQLFGTNQSVTSTATYQLNSGGTSIPSNTYPLTTSNVTYTAGKFGNAATFTGSNAGSGTQLSVSNSIYQGNTSIFSVSLWVKCTNTVGEIPLSGNGGTIGGTQGYALYLNNGSLALTFRSSNGSQDFYYGSSINDNAWHNVVLTFNNGPYAVYLDGTLDFSGTTGNFLNNTTPSFNTFFGNRWGRAGDNNAVIAGQMDQIRVFGSTVLPQAAITALYNETTTTAQSASVDYQLANPNSIAYYKMSDATDQFGNYNGTATNVNFNTEGKFGFAGAFNGGASYLNLNSAVLPASVFSVSMWINLNSLSTGWLFSQYTGSVTGRFVFNVTSTGGFQINVSSTNSLSTTNIPVITTNNWHHVVVVKDGSNGWTLYADGASHSTWNNTANIITNQNTILGGDDVVTSPNMVGKIDQVRIYDSALSAANVTTLYNEIECPVIEFAVDYLVVAGGGGGGAGSSASSSASGGGGAGGLRTSYGSTTGGGAGAESSLTLSIGSIYTVTVGNGGSGQTIGGTAQSSGLNSVFSSITSTGGGKAGARQGSSASSGGSGGGAAWDAPVQSAGSAVTSPVVQGYGGGLAASSGGDGGGGGGGASAVGNPGVNNTGGDGGAGLQVNIDGNNYYYAGGGGGGARFYSGSGGVIGSGGIGGGGNSGTPSGGTGVSGTPNTGGGGGASGKGAAGGGTAGSGGSGVVIISYPTSKVSSFTVTGTLNTPTPSIVGTNSVLKFTTGTGTITFS